MQRGREQESNNVVAQDRYADVVKKSGRKLTDEELRVASTNHDYVEGEKDYFELCYDSSCGFVGSINIILVVPNDFDTSDSEVVARLDRLDPRKEVSNSKESCMSEDSVFNMVTKQQSGMWSGRYDSDASHKCNILLGGTNLVVSTPIYDSNGGLDDTTIKQSSGYTEGHMQLGTIKQPSGYSNDHAQLGSRIRYNHGGKHNDDRKSKQIVITKRDVLAKQSWMEGTVWYMTTAGQSLMKSKKVFQRSKNIWAIFTEEGGVSQQGLPVSSSRLSSPSYSPPCHSWWSYF